MQRNKCTPCRCLTSAGRGTVGTSNPTRQRNMAGTIIDMSKIKQFLQLKKSGVSNRQIARDLQMNCDKHYYSVPYTLIGCKLNYFPAKIDRRPFLFGRVISSDNETISKTMLMKRHQRIVPLFSDEFWVTR